MVESDEVIHVRVGDENGMDLEQLARGQGMQIPQIEENGIPAVPAFQVDAGIAERVIDQ